MQIIIRRLSVKGFIMINHLDEAQNAIEELSNWRQKGDRSHVEGIQEGFTNTPRTLLRLFEGKTLSKQLIKL